MAVEERKRRLLQEALVSTIGSDSTDTLMGYLPPVGWADVATKEDLRNLELRLRAEIGTLRQGVDSQIGTLRQGVDSQIGTLRQEVDSRLESMESKMGAMELRFEARFAKFETRLHDELRRQFYWTVTVMMLLLTLYTTALKLL